MDASTHQEGWFCSPKLQASERMGETPTIKGQPGKVKKEKCSDTLVTTLFSKKTWTGLTLFVPYLHRLMASYNARIARMTHTTRARYHCTDAYIGTSPSSLFFSHLAHPVSTQHP